MQCVVLAGGLGARMRPLTDVYPKALLPIHGRPFAWYQMQWFVRQGVSEIVYCIGYKGEMIRAYWDENPHPGVSIRYVDEGGELAGTAGALRLAFDQGVLCNEFLVHYGDSFLPVEFVPILNAFNSCGMPALMTVMRNEGKWDRSNAIYENHRVSLYDKNPPAEVHQRMSFIDFGLSILRRSMVQDLVSPQTRCDLSGLFHVLSRSSRLAGFEVTERFYEIGSATGLAEFAECALSLPFK